MGIADLLNELDIKEPLPSYSPSLYRVTGGKGEAIALAQLIYKCAKSNWGTVRLNLTDWENEIQLSRREFDNLNNCIVELELGNIDLCYVASVKKMAYTLNKEAVYNALKDTSVIYGVRNKLRRLTKEVTQVNETSVKWQGNKVRRSMQEVAYIKDSKDFNKSKQDNKDNLAKTSFADFQQPLSSDLFEATKAEPAKPKPPKEPKEKPAPKFERFNEFKEMYLFWYKNYTGIAHTFGPKEAGQMGKLITQLKQIVTGDEALALQTFQALLTNWDNLEKFYRSKPQLNSIVSNLNAIVNNLKAENEFTPEFQQQCLDEERAKGRNWNSFNEFYSDYLAKQNAYTF